MSAHWSQKKEAGTLLGLRISGFLYRFVGRRLCYIFSIPVITYFFATNSSARFSSRQYLEKIQQQGGIAKDSSLLWWSYKHFLSFGQTLIDKIGSWTGTFHYSNVSFHNRQEFVDLIDKKQGALVVVSHLGNLEVSQALINTSRKVKLNILVHTPHAENFNRLRQKLITNDSLNLIQVEAVSPAVAITLKEKIDAGEMVAIAGDRTPLQGGRKSTVTFFGADADFPQGPYVFASVLQCPVYLMFCLKEKTGYRVYFDHFADKIRLPRQDREKGCTFWAQKYAERLAHYALHNPLQWNNFYPFWIHPESDDKNNP